MEEQELAEMMASFFFYILTICHYVSTFLLSQCSNNKIWAVMQLMCVCVCGLLMVQVVVLVHTGRCLTHCCHDWNGFTGAVGNQLTESVARGSGAVSVISKRLNQLHGTERTMSTYGIFKGNCGLFWADKNKKFIFEKVVLSNLLFCYLIIQPLVQFDSWNQCIPNGFISPPTHLHVSISLHQQEKKKNTMAAITFGKRLGGDLYALVFLFLIVNHTSDLYMTHPVVCPASSHYAAELLNPSLTF